MRAVWPLLRSRWREEVLWSCGTALVVLLVPGQLDYALMVRWQLSHAGRGEHCSAVHRQHYLVTPLARVSPITGDGVEMFVASAAEDGLCEVPRRVARYTGIETALGEATASTLMASTVRAMAVKESRLAVLVSGWRLHQLDAASLVQDGEGVDIKIVLDESAEAAVLFSDWQRVYVVAAAHGTTSVAAVEGGRLVWGPTPPSSLGRAYSFAGTLSAGPQPRPNDAWQADARFWAASSGATDETEEYLESSSGKARDLVERCGPSYETWTALSESVRLCIFDHIVAVRTSRGILAYNGSDTASRLVGSAFLPPSAFHADLDGDGAIDSVAVVESHRPKPRRRKAMRRAANSLTVELPPCIAVATRGFPPVERFAGLDEASLCHDGGADKELELRKRLENRDSSKNARRVYAAPPRRDASSGDLVFAVSRGVLAKLDPTDGTHRWLSREAPSWSYPGAGSLLVFGSLYLVLGDKALALFESRDGSSVASHDLPFLWDDETALRPPLLVDIGTSNPGARCLVIIITQFAIHGVSIESTLRGTGISRLLIFLIALLLPTLLVLSLVDSSSGRPDHHAHLS